MHRRCPKAEARSSTLAFQACTRTQSKAGAKVPTLVAIAIGSAVARRCVRSRMRSDPHASGSRARSATIGGRASKSVSRAATGRMDKSASRMKIVLSPLDASYCSDTIRKADNVPFGHNSPTHSAHSTCRSGSHAMMPMAAQHRDRQDKARANPRLALSTRGASMQSSRDVAPRRTRAPNKRPEIHSTARDLIALQPHTWTR